MMQDKQITNKTIALFGDSDSQIFGLLPHANAFKKRDWHVTIVIENFESIPSHVLKRVTANFQSRQLKFNKFHSYVLSENFDVVGVFSRGSKLHQFRMEFEKLCLKSQHKRPKIFTGYNGLTYEKFEEGLAWRLGYDVIALNGPRDFTLFSDFVSFGKCHAQPSVITGLAQSKQPPELGGFEKQANRKKSMVFAEQVIVPTSKIERYYLVEQLVRIAIANPDWEILIKCRVRSHEKTFHNVKYHFENILNSFNNRPNNLKITYTDLPQLLKEAALFATISSTAIFEALNNGIPSIIISDFGVKNSHGTHVFSNSKITKKLANIGDLSLAANGYPSQKWLNWIGASNIKACAIVDYFETQKIRTEGFEPQLYCEADIDIWNKAKKKNFIPSGIKKLFNKVRKLL